MARSKRHPLYICMMVLMVIICLAGLALLIYGGATHSRLPRVHLPLITPGGLHG